MTGVGLNDEQSCTRRIEEERVEVGVILTRKKTIMVCESQKSLNPEQFLDGRYNDKDGESCFTSINHFFLDASAAGIRERSMWSDTSLFNPQSI